jgi:hypothetical protein
MTKRTSTNLVLLASAFLVFAFTLINDHLREFASLREELEELRSEAGCHVIDKSDLERRLMRLEIALTFAWREDENER